MKVLLTPELAIQGSTSPQVTGQWTFPRRHAPVQRQRPQSAKVSRTHRNGVQRRPGVLGAEDSEFWVGNVTPRRPATARNRENKSAPSSTALSIEKMVARQVHQNYATVLESLRTLCGKEDKMTRDELRRLLAFSAGVQLDDQQFSLLCGDYFLPGGREFHFRDFLRVLASHIPGGFRRDVTTIRSPRPRSAHNPMWISRCEIEAQDTIPSTRSSRTVGTPNKPAPAYLITRRDQPTPERHRYLQQRAFGEGDPHGYGYANGMYAPLRICMKKGRPQQGWPGANAYPWTTPQGGHSCQAPGPATPIPH